MREYGSIWRVNFPSHHPDMRTLYTPNGTVIFESNCNWGERRGGKHDRSEWLDINSRKREKKYIKSEIVKFVCRTPGRNPRNISSLSWHHCIGLYFCVLFSSFSHSHGQQIGTFIYIYTRSTFFFLTCVVDPSSRIPFTHQPWIERMKTRYTHIYINYCVPKSSFYCRHVFCYIYFCVIIEFVSLSKQTFMRHLTLWPSAIL